MILVIDKLKKNAINVSDMFFYMGVIARPASLHEAFSEISTVYRAIVLLSPSSYPDTEDFITRLQTYSSNTPIFAIGEVDERCSELVSRTLPSSAYAAEILSEIIEYTSDKYLPQPGDYRLMGLDLSCTIPSPMYSGTTLPLTKTEAMILRYLIRAYPAAAATEDILKYAYRETRAPESSNIRTHISIINKKFRALTQRNLLEMSLGIGYKFITSDKLSKTV